MLMILSLLACIYLAISSAYVSRSLVLAITGILVVCHWNSFVPTAGGVELSTFVEKAAFLDNLDCFKLLKDNDYTLSSELYLGAVKSGRINIMICR